MATMTSHSSKIEIVDHVDADLAQHLFELVNTAYKIEMGDTGIAFKRSDRFDCLATAQEAFEKAVHLVLAKNDEDTVVGVGVLTKMDEQIELGPFAVLPGLQGTGIGRMILTSVFDVARGLGASHLQIGLVEHRTDLIAFYRDKFSFVEVGERVDFQDKKEAFREDELTRPTQMLTMRKRL